MNTIPLLIFFHLILELEFYCLYIVFLPCIYSTASSSEGCTDALYSPGFYFVISYFNRNIM